MLIYIALLEVWKIGLKLFYCKKCINFACPFKVVDNYVRDKFFHKNRIVKQAWKK